MKSPRWALFVLALWLSMAPKASFAAPDEYDDSQSNPFRVAAYLIYPVGFMLEWTIFRPLHFLVSGTEPLEAFFGHKPHPPVIAEPQPYPYYGVPRRVPLTQPPPSPAKTAAKEPPVETVRVVEVPVEKIVVREVPKIIEVEKFVFPDIAFRFDSADLTELGKGKVYLAAQKLKEKSDMAFVIEGHTDSTGSDQYNQKLGLRRAEAVMKELAGLGVDPGTMSAASLGETKPLLNQETDWARAINRRVEFQVKGR